MQKLVKPRRINIPVWLLGLLVGALSACTQIPVAPNHHACTDIYRAAEYRAAHRYFSYTPIAGAAFLRVDRQLASQIPRANTPELRLQWLRWANAMANEALALGAPSCIDPLLQHLANDKRAWQKLVARATVPAEYRTSLRALGLYPVTRLAFLAGVNRELAHTAEEQAAFSDDALAWQLFAPASGAGWHTSAVLEGVSGVDWSSLFDRWAPQFALPSESGAANLPGSLVRTGEGQLRFDGRDPRVYVYPSLGWFNGRQTLQLNYQIWFLERPAQGPLDFLSGTLDGLHWRVHLTMGGEPIAFDAMHTCGCWYQLYPAAGYVALAPESFWQEPHYVGPIQALSAGPRLYLSADTHRLLTVRPSAPHQAAVSMPMTPVQWASGGVVGPLTADATHYWSIFNRAGRVPESVRSERFFFWPMGVPAAGSHRAPGHHAVAFTGRRHFDDPAILDELIQVPGR